MSEIEKVSERINLIINQKTDDVCTNMEKISEIVELIGRNDDVSVETMKRVYDFIRNNLNSGNIELQNNTVSVLLECFKKKLFEHEGTFNPLRDVVIYDGIMNNNDLKLIKNEESFLKTIEIVFSYVSQIQDIQVVTRDEKFFTDLFKMLRMVLGAQFTSSPMKINVSEFNLLY